jgi:hypothetical protein
MGCRCFLSLSAHASAAGRRVFRRNLKEMSFNVWEGLSDLTLKDIPTDFPPSVQSLNLLFSDLVFKWWKAPFEVGIDGVLEYCIIFIVISRNRESFHEYISSKGFFSRNIGQRSCGTERQYCWEAYENCCSLVTQ